MHEARKAAKRLRYGAEVLRPSWGKDAKRLVKAAKRSLRCWVSARTP